MHACQLHMHVKQHYWQHIRVSPVLYLESVSHMLMACEDGNYLGLPSGIRHAL